MRVSPLAERGMFEAALFILPAGYSFPIHDHPGTCAVTYGISGRIKVTGYSQLMAHVDGSVVLSLDHETRLTPGAVSTLTVDRSNVHGLFAEVPSQFVDIFTPPFDIETTKKIRNLKIIGREDANAKHVVAIPSKIT